VETDLKSVEGLGCATLIGGEVPADPDAKAKDMAGFTTTVIECSILPLSALQMGLPTKPPKPAPPPAEGEGEGEAPGEEKPDEITWSVIASSVGTVALSVDQTAALALTALSDSWEKANPGRSAKAKGVRDGYLAELEETGAPVEEAVGDGFEGVTASARILEAGEKTELRSKLDENLEQLTTDRQAASEKRTAMRDVRAAASQAAVLSVASSRSELKEAHAAAMADAAALVAQFAPEPPPPPEAEDKKGKKGKK